MQPTIIGLDLAKHVFHVHSINATGNVVIRKKLRRSELKGFFAKLPSCVVGMEACGSAHYWGRELSALGHQVRLMPASYVKAYVKRGKNDEIDAEAICEAVTRPTIRFVPVKTAEQQSILMLHRTRELCGQKETDRDGYGLAFGAAAIFRRRRSYRALFGTRSVQGASGGR